ncbi:hypothetical protein D3C71_2014570 [compost metagenome]
MNSDELSFGFSCCFALSNGPKSARSFALLLSCSDIQSRLALDTAGVSDMMISYFRFLYTISRRGNALDKYVDFA